MAKNLIRDLVFVVVTFCVISMKGQNLKVSGGYTYSAFINSSGEVYVTGQNVGGVLGVDAGLTSRALGNYTSFQKQNGIPKMKSIDGGSGDHILALSCDSCVYAWGSNWALQCGVDNDGRLGNESWWYHAQGQQVYGVGGVGNLCGATFVSGGTEASYAILSSKRAVGWGHNNNGELGRGTVTAVGTYYMYPEYILDSNSVPLENVIMVEAGDESGYALVDDDGDGVGVVYSWGGNQYNQLGRIAGLNDGFAKPIKTTTGNLGGIVMLTAGDAFGLAVDTNGNVWSWGDNTFGQYGNGTLNAPNNYAVKVLSGVSPGAYLGDADPVISVAAGQKHGMVATKGGLVYTWGAEQVAQLGNGWGQTTHQSTPIQAMENVNTPITNVVSVSDGDYVTFAIKNDGTIYVTGLNDFGQLGDGTTTNTAYFKPMTLNGVLDVPCIQPYLGGDQTLCSLNFPKSLEIGIVPPGFRVTWFKDGVQVSTEDVTAYKTVSYNATALGKYKVTVEDIRLASDRPCEACVLTSDSMEFFLATPLAVVGTDQSGCLGNDFTLSGNTQGGYTNQWSGEPVGATYAPNNSTANAVISNLPIGVHKLFWTITDVGSGCSHSDSLVVTVNPADLGVSFAPDTVVCMNKPAYSLGATPYGGVYTGAGVNDTIFDASLAGVGSHDVKYVVTSAGCSDSAVVSIEVDSVPIVSLGILSDVCENESDFILTGGAPSLNGTGVYKVNGVAEASFVISNYNAGNHTIEYVFTDSKGCKDSTSRTFELRAIPSVNLSFMDSTECINAPVRSLTEGTPNGGVYSGSGIQGGVNFDPSIAGNGVHTIKYLYSVNGCADSAEANLKVDSLTPIIFNSIGPYCDNEGVVKITTASPLGGVFSGVGVKNDSLDLGVNGIGQVQYLYANSFGCKDSTTINVVVNVSPVVSLGALGELCLGDSLQFTSHNPAGGNFKGVGVVGNKFYSSLSGLGTHQIEYVVSNNFNCKDSANTSIVVNDVPSVSLVPLQDVCENEGRFVLNNGTPLVSSLSEWAEYRIDGVSSINFDPSNVGIGVRTIEYVFEDANGCRDSAAISLEVFSKPNVSFGKEGKQCLNGDTLQLLNGLPINGTYLGTGVVGDKFVPLKAGVGIHTLQYVYVDLNQCSDTAISDIEVVNHPSFSLGSDIEVCSFPYTLSANHGGPVFNWSSGGTDSLESIGGSGTYVLEIQDSNLCKAKDTIIVSQASSLSISATSTDSVHCEQGLFVAINAEVVDGQVYTWKHNGNIVGDTKQMDADAPGWYFVDVLNDKGCAGVDSIYIYDGAFKINLLLDTNVLCEKAGELVGISVDSNYASIVWSTLENQQSIEVSKAGVYWVEVENDLGCKVSDTATIDLYCKGVKITLPNVFTPNGDGVNEEFVPLESSNPDYGEYLDYLHSVEFNIFNRWGVEVYASSGVLPKWDGRNQTNMVSDGVYYWVLSYSDVNGMEYQNNGFVTVVSK